MNFLSVKRRETAEVATAPKRPELENYIISNFRLTYPAAVVSVVQFWFGLSHTWRPSNRKGKGKDGYPLGLVHGIKFIDKLFTGTANKYPLYENHQNRFWTVPQITQAMAQFNIAAHSPEHQPLDPARKLALCRTSLSAFFWNGKIKGEPNPYTHAPFLFFFDRGAVRHENSMKKAVASSDYLFNGFLEIFKNCCEDPERRMPTAAHNRLVRMTDALFSHFNGIQDKLPPSDRTPAVVLACTQQYFSTWRPPVRIQAFACERAIEDIKALMTDKATYVSIQQPVYTKTVTIADVYQPTAILNDIDNGDSLSAFCAYCNKEGLIVDPFTVDVRKLVDNGHLALRQLARLWRLGQLVRAEKTPAHTTDWKSLIEAQKAKLGIA